METEEHEQIPWAHLVAEAEQGVDKRMYLLIGGAAAVVVVIFAIRFFGASAAPTPPVAVDVAPETTVTSPSATMADESFVPTTVGEISQADLMAAVPGSASAVPDEVSAVAEWFVTDYFTRDGSGATLASLETRLATDLAVGLPHHDHTGPDSFVEWATAFAVRESEAGFTVEVAFRTVTRTEAGFVRDPVRAVAVSMTAAAADGWRVTAVPVHVDVP